MTGNRVVRRIEHKVTIIKCMYVGRWAELSWERLVAFFKTRNNICPYVCK
jgi:hypothetical protein